LAPTVAFRKPAMPAQNAPARQAATMASTTCKSAGMPANDEPTQIAAIDPTMYCPWPPMLNRPARKANATARPTRMNGVVRISVCCRLSAAVARSSPLTHGKTHCRPVPSKIAL
jgi:hypothetical protein